MSKCVPSRSRTAWSIISCSHSRTSSTPEFVAAVDAREAVIPVGYRNRFGHPKAEVVERHAAAGSRLWRTDRDGAVTIYLGPDSAVPEAWRQVRRRYWQNDPALFGQ